MNRMLICLRGVHFENFRKNPIEKIACDGSLMYGVSLGISWQRCKRVWHFCMTRDWKRGRGRDRQTALGPAVHNKVRFFEIQI